MTGVGVRYVGLYDCDDRLLPCVATGAVVRGRVTSAGGPDLGRGVAGLPVTGNVDYGFVLTYVASATTDADGWFELGVNENFFSLGPAHSWTASTEGDAAYAGSSTAGTFLPVPYSGL